MAEIILTATPRPPQGTRPARRLRNEGKIPGVVYGLGADPITLTVEWRELRAALVTEQGLNAVIHLEIDGDRTPTLVKDMQRHPVRRNVLHVDFIRVDLDKTVDVEVTIHLEGEAEAVTREGGVVDQVLQALAHHTPSRPTSRPASPSTSRDLEIGDAKHVSDITLPDGVTTPSTPTSRSSPPATASPRPSSRPLRPRWPARSKAKRARPPRAKPPTTPRPAPTVAMPTAATQPTGGDEG